MNEILESATVLEETPGKILKAAREARQISISEVTQRLLLSKGTIVAIEEDDYSRIAAQVYAEGYLKAYAQFLQIPVDTILESFRRLNVYPRSETKVETKTQTQEQSCRCVYQELTHLLKGKCRWHVILGVVAILILGVLVVFIGKQFFGKNIEVVHVPNRENKVVNKTDNDKVLSDNQIPIITTTTSENVSVSIPQIVSKKKQDPKKTEKPDTQEASLMLDNNNYDEPNLILTKPKTPTVQ